MKLILTLAFSVLTMILHAQSAENVNPDNKESFKLLPKGIIRQEIASFSTYGGAEKDPKIKLVPITQRDDGRNYISISKGDLTVIIKTKPFDESQHKLTYKDSRVTRIDGKYFYGTNGRIPRESIASVEVIIGTDTLRLPQHAYADLFEPQICIFNSGDPGENVCSPQPYTSPDKRRVYIFMINGDGAGAYESTWIIEDKKYLRRVLDYEL